MLTQYHEVYKVDAAFINTMKLLLSVPLTLLLMDQFTVKGSVFIWLILFLHETQHMSKEYWPY